MKFKNLFHWVEKNGTESRLKVHRPVAMQKKKKMKKFKNSSLVIDGVTLHFFIKKDSQLVPCTPKRPTFQCHIAHATSFTRSCFSFLLVCARRVFSFLILFHNTRLEVRRNFFSCSFENHERSPQHAHYLQSQSIVTNFQPLAPTASSTQVNNIDDILFTFNVTFSLLFRQWKTLCQFQNINPRSHAIFWAVQ